MALLLQIRRHAAPHYSKTNKSNFHFVLSSGCLDQLRFAPVLSFDLRDFVFGKTKTRRACVALDLFGAACASDSPDHRGISQCPRDGDLPGRASMTFANF